MRKFPSTREDSFCVRPTPKSPARGRVVPAEGGPCTRRPHIKGRSARSVPRKLVELLGEHHAAKALVVALDRGSLLALTFGGGLFVEFAGTEFREEAGLFDGALEATKSNFKRFVFFNADSRHQTPSCDDPEMTGEPSHLVPGQDGTENEGRILAYFSCGYNARSRFFFVLSRKSRTRFSRFPAPRAENTVEEKTFGEATSRSPNR